MINLGTFFKLHFDSKDISDDNIKKFAQDHIQRLIANNDANQYDQMITDTVSAYDTYFGAITDEDTAQALQESRSITVDNLFKQFQDTVSQKEGIIKGTWGKDSPEYQEFFPHGLNEYHQANKANVETLIDRMVDASTAHVAELGQPFVDLFTNLQTDYTNARNTQLNQIGIVASDKSETAETRDVLEIQLGRNVLSIALEYIGKPAKAKVFFDESIIPNRASGDDEGDDEEGGEPTGIITAITDQSVLNDVKLTLANIAMGDFEITWGDGGKVTLALDDTDEYMTHGYGSEGVYTIEIKGSLETLSHLSLKESRLTSVTIKNLPNLEDLRLDDNIITDAVIKKTPEIEESNFQNNSMTEKTVNKILIAYDNMGINDGNLYLQGGTNASPTGGGIVAKDNLISRGVNVVVN